MLIFCLKSSPITISACSTKLLQPAHPSADSPLPLPRPPNPRTPHTVSNSKFSERCGFTALCLYSEPFYPPRMSFNCLKTPPHVSKPKSSFISHNSRVSTWTAHCSVSDTYTQVNKVNLSLLEQEKSCLNSLGSIFTALQSVLQRNGTQNI